MANPRSVVRVARPAPARHGSYFEALRIGGEIFGREADPWLNLDHFRMAGPTFPPHPHAGFSAVTYVLPESPGAMANRDSRGDRSVIGPGAVHWTAAGSGIVHEEIPAIEGTITEGFQIFIRQPVEQESLPADISHVDAAAVPVIALPAGGAARVVAGGDAPFATPSPLTMLDVTLAEGERFDWTPPAGHSSLALYLFEGAIAIDGLADDVTAPAVAVFARGEGGLGLKVIDGAARLLVMAGVPLDVPSVTNGPFVLSSPAAIEAAVGRYRAGAMGRLPADWD
ncbi:pirin family protein [Sphingomonas sp. SRS2]|uniref:pirin family protein n=1 Tax=Sphingomonas sp. SRS2 TaxID=133190 RepID=UPI0006184CE6|nr:pirin family protein [Sphingomonas sp. SRS2]KKC26470.1 hypothetical protein WP12_08325 [Sphingomonas sp. SRS2]